MEKLSFFEVQQRFITQRDDIVICEDGFKGWKRKSKFWDCVVQDYFWAIPKNVYGQQSCHPKRAEENRRKTNLEKYGNRCSLHGSTEKAKVIQNKVKEAFINRFGVENPAKSDEVKRMIVETVKKKWGVDNVSQSNKIKEKKKQTTIENYGVEHQMLAPEIKEKFKQTNLRLYGVEHPSQSEEIKTKKRKTFETLYDAKSPFHMSSVREKARKAMKEKYGAETYWETKKIRIENTDLFLFDWWKSLPNPKMSYGVLYTRTNKKNPISLDEVNKIVVEYHENKTSLERESEKLFGIKHYNRKPKQLKKLYKPDFKISDLCYVNVDGLYWHSEKEKSKEYHYLLREEFEKAGLRILQFRENEIRDKPEIVKSIINIANNTNVMSVRQNKCEIQTIKHKEAIEFLKQNHIFGASNISSKHIGLYNKEQLVSVMSYKVNNNKCRILRWCNKINHSIDSFRVLSRYLETNISGIKQISYTIDLRFESDEQMTKFGYSILEDKVDWTWTNKYTIYNKFMFKEHKEDMIKIWDAGQRILIKHI